MAVTDHHAGATLSPMPGPALALTAVPKVLDLAAIFLRGRLEKADQLALYDATGAVILDIWEEDTEPDRWQRFKTSVRVNDRRSEGRIGKLLAKCQRVHLPLVEATRIDDDTLEQNFTDGWADPLYIWLFLLFAAIGKRPDDDKTKTSLAAIGAVFPPTTSKDGRDVLDESGIREAGKWVQWSLRLFLRLETAVISNTRLASVLQHLYFTKERNDASVARHLQAALNATAAQTAQILTTICTALSFVAAALVAWIAMLIVHGSFQHPAGIIAGALTLLLLGYAPITSLAQDVRDYLAQIRLANVITREAQEHKRALKREAKRANELESGSPRLDTPQQRESQPRDASPS